MSISLHELAIALSLGQARLPMFSVIIATGAQAFLAAQLGLASGARIGERYREAAEGVAGLVLIGLGPFLIPERLFA